MIHLQQTLCNVPTAGGVPDLRLGDALTEHGQVHVLTDVLRQFRHVGLAKPLRQHGPKHQHREQLHVGVRTVV